MACPACGSECGQRLPMNSTVAAVYDALFMGDDRVLDWAESEDCGMNEMMLNVAETAARAALEASS